MELQALDQWRDDDGGAKGRQGYWSDSFVVLHRYDEHLKGSGHEDIDFQKRWMAKRWEVKAPLTSQWKKLNAGYSIPNDPSGDMTVSHGQANIAHVD